MVIYQLLSDKKCEDAVIATWVSMQIWTDYRCWMHFRLDEVDDENEETKTKRKAKNIMKAMKEIFLGSF